MRNLILVVLVSLASLIMTSCYEEVCSPNPCQNNGVCSEDQGTYSCECPTGFSGQNCETKDCNCDMEYAPVCGEDGITYGNSCQAACADATIDHTGVCVVDPCKDFTCVENSTCNVIDNSATCICDDGFQMINDVCVPVNECNVDSDCGDRQVCVNGECKGTGLLCNADNQCNAGEVCVEGQCIVECPEVLCDLYCENGFKKDTNGCDTCECIEAPNECRENSDCDTGQVCKFETFCGVGTCVEEVMCPDVMCMLACGEAGFKKDSNGCEICECAEPSNECQMNSDCASGEYCKFETYCGAGVCTPTDVVCNVDSDCGEMSACVNGECKGTGLLCDGDNQCDEGEVCVEGQCIAEPSCIENTDCNEGQFCVNGECKGTGLLCDGDNQCSEGEVCVEGQCIAEPSCIENTDCNEGQFCVNGECKGTGLLCNSDNQCSEGEVCVEGQCIAEPNQCSSNADCEMGKLCQTTSNDNIGTCQDCECTSEYAPVCGENGITYSNSCVANCARADVSYEGICR